MVALVPLMLAGLLAGGCGGSSRSANGEAGRPPEQILRDAATALAAVHSVQVQGTGDVERQPTALSIAIERPNDMSLQMQRGDQSVLARLVGGVAYFNANAAFYERTAHAPSTAAAALMAGRWLKVPPNEGFEELTKALNLSKFAHCLDQNTGTLSLGGTSTVAGRPAVIVVDQGDRPGTTPSKLYVATTGSPLPLRAVATGRQRPGGNAHAECSESGEPAQPGQELLFSRYNSPMHITAPARAVSPSELVQSLRSGARPS